MCMWPKYVCVIQVCVWPKYVWPKYVCGLQVCVFDSSVCGLKFVAQVCVGAKCV